MCRTEGDLERAEELFDKACSLGVAGGYHAALGEVALKRGNLEKARLHLKKALQLGEEKEQVYSNLGMAEAKLGNEKKAEEAFLLSLKKNPKSARSYHNLIAHYVNSRRYGDALILLDTAYERTGLASFLQVKEELSQKMMHFLRDAEDRIENNPHFANQVSEYYLRLGKKADAIRVLEKVILSAPKKEAFTVNLYVNLAQLLKEKNRGRALELLREALSWEPPGKVFLEQMLNDLSA